MIYHLYENIFCILVKDNLFMKWAGKAPYSSFLTLFFDLWERSDDPDVVTALWSRPESWVECSIDPVDSRTCFLFGGFDGSPTSDKELLCRLLCVEVGWLLCVEVGRTLCVEVGRLLLVCEFLRILLCIENWREEFINELPLDFS